MRCVPLGDLGSGAVLLGRLWISGKPALDQEAQRLRSRRDAISEPPVVYGFGFRPSDHYGQADIFRFVAHLGKVTRRHNLHKRG